MDIVGCFVWETVEGSAESPQELLSVSLSGCVTYSLGAKSTEADPGMVGADGRGADSLNPCATAACCIDASADELVGKAESEPELSKRMWLGLMCKRLSFSRRPPVDAKPLGCILLLLAGICLLRIGANPMLY